MTTLKEIISESENQTLEIGRQFASVLNPGDVVALIGDLGAGKTIFVKGIVAGLGFKPENVFSASFVLVQEYKAEIPVYHIDLYRLDYQEVVELDWDSYLDDEHIVLIEWAEKVKEFLEFDFKIHIEFKNKNRKITIWGARDVSIGH